MTEQNHHIVLVGFMGSGKTTIGNTLAAMTGLQHKDTDSIIEESAGTTISEMFRVQGERHFRYMETRTLEILADQQNVQMIYSTGGGIVMRQENQQLLHRLGIVVWLRIQPQTVIDRLGDDNTRPLLQGPDREQKVRDLIDARRGAYMASADVIVDVDGKAPQEIAAEILQQIGMEPA